MDKYINYTILFFYIFNDLHENSILKEKKYNIFHH